MVNQKIETVIIDMMKNQKSFSAFDVTNETRKQNPSLFLIHSQIKTTIHQTVKQNLSKFNYHSDMKTVGNDSFVYYSPVSNSVTIPDTKSKSKSKSKFEDVIILRLNHSSFISSAAYDVVTKELKIDFTDCKSYIYQGVEREIVEEFENWDSHGEYFNMDIKNKYPFIRG